MKIYLAASASAEDKTYQDKVLEVGKKIISLGHELVNPYFKSLINKDSNLNKDENVYKSLKESIESSDCLIAEISYPSISLGIQIQYALSNSIPVLCLFQDHLKPELPIMIRDYKDPILFKESYNSSKDSILKKIKKFFDNFPQSRIKFNLFITHKINNFLIKETKESGLSKSEIIRNIINDFIDKSSRK